MSSTELHVLIIGGGIGGLCLAQGLKANGVSVAVYERNAVDSWLEGFRIHINPIGSSALHQNLPPDSWDAFVALAGKPPAGLGFLTEQLKELVVIGDESTVDRSHDPVHAHYPVSRLALRQLLLTGVEDVLHYNKTFERYEQMSDGKVTAYFSDGSSATGDVLIGADGANSRVRKQYLPHAQRVEIGAGGMGGKVLLTPQSRAWLPRQLTIRMNLTMPLAAPYCLFTTAFDHAQESEEARNHVLASTSEIGLDPNLLDDTQNYMLWAFFAHTNEYPADIQQLDEQDLLRVLKKMTSGWHPDLRRLIAESTPGSVSYTTFKASEIIEPWRSSNVTLLGDSIHNMPPVGGLGGNAALRDAQALTLALTSVQQGQSSLLPAIQVYEAGMRKFGFGAILAALQYTQLTTTNNLFARGSSRIWFQLCNAIPSLKRTFEESWTEPMRDQSADPVK
jgi:2-polyprenyl-6-methoxyphenol hydroxylase-like FAD-dependent oxidoreductase